ncbi:hypothetical protein ABMA08_16995 [Pseudomonas yamanorum]
MVASLNTSDVATCLYYHPSAFVAEHSRWFNRQYTGSGNQISVADTNTYDAYQNFVKPRFIEH